MSKILCWLGRHNDTRIVHFKWEYGMNQRIKVCNGCDLMLEINGRRIRHFTLLPMMLGFIVGGILFTLLRIYLSGGG